MSRKKVLVSDTSILKDLDRGSLVEPIFSARLEALGHFHRP